MLVNFTITWADSETPHVGCCMYGHTCNSNTVLHDNHGHDAPTLLMRIFILVDGKDFSLRDLNTLRSLSGPFVARMLSFWSSCTMRPQNLRNVRGSLTAGFTSISTFLEVCTNSACKTHSNLRLRSHINGKRSCEGSAVGLPCVLPTFL